MKREHLPLGVGDAVQQGHHCWEKGVQLGGSPNRKV